MFSSPAGAFVFAGAETVTFGGGAHAGMARVLGSTGSDSRACSPSIAGAAFCSFLCFARGLRGVPEGRFFTRRPPAGLWLRPLGQPATSLEG